MQDRTKDDITMTLLQDLLKEKRSERRWKNVRFLFWFALIAFFIFGIIGFISSSSKHLEGGKYVSLIRLDGMIAPGRDMSAAELMPILSEAFKDKKALGVVIDINSPGGTPVQSAIIHDAILYYKKKYKKKVVVVGEDMLTSGAYYVSVAADQIYVNPNTLTGSIGVIMKGFGFVDVMKKIGVERRVYTSGTDKDRLDPFLPQNPEDLKKIQSIMDEVHQNFAQAVIEGRKGKLKVEPQTLFTGDFWSGQTALKLGLVDGLGNIIEAMDKEFNTTKFKEYNTSASFMRMLGVQMSSAVDAMVYSFS